MTPYNAVAGVGCLSGWHVNFAPCRGVYTVNVSCYGRDVAHRRVSVTAATSNRTSASEPTSRTSRGPGRSGSSSNSAGRGSAGRRSTRRGSGRRGRRRPDSSRGDTSDDSDDDDDVAIEPGGDFVVIGKVDRPSAVVGAVDEALSGEELTDLDGGAVWAALDPLLVEDEEEEADEAASEEEEEFEDVEEELRWQPPPQLQGGEESEEAVRWRRIYTSTEVPGRQTGPVVIRRMKDRGRGLATTEDVPLGSLLLVSIPLGLLYSSGPGATPENEELADKMLTRQRYEPQQIEFLRMLWDGKSATATPSMEALDIGTEGGRMALSFDAATWYRIVALNCYGEEFEDPVLTQLRSSGSSSSSSCGHLGIWPELAFINHSCAPNAVAYIIGGNMVVRATQDIRKGEEVTINYVGSLITYPTDNRRAELQDKYGFECRCPRCQMESTYANQQLQQLQRQIAATCAELAPKLDAEVEAAAAAATAGEPSGSRAAATAARVDDDGGAETVASSISSMRDRLEALRAEYEQLLRQQRVPAKARRWLQASVYDLYDLLSLCADQLSPSVETEALAVCTRLLGSVAAGTDSHLELATEYMLRAEQRFGLDAQETQGATRLCVDAYRARYGVVSDTLLGELINTRANL